MYNPEIVFKMLEDRGIPHVKLLEFLGQKNNRHLRRTIEGDIKASNLEKIADFFGVPIDTFFDRPAFGNQGVVFSGTGNSAGDIRINTTEIKNELMHQLLEEKDKRIANLEELIENYRGKSGQK